jgi:hypothetical protein
MKKKLGEHCPKMVRWYGSSIEDQEFPIPGKMSSLGRGERAVADEELRVVSMHILIRQLGKPYQEEIAAFDRQFQQHATVTSQNQVQQLHYTSRLVLVVCDHQSVPPVLTSLL